MAPEDFEGFLTAAEASALLNAKGIKASAKTLNEKGRSGRVPSHKPNGYRRFRISELLEHYAGMTKAAET